MVLVGGEISALLLGFALVAAIGMRRGVWNEARRLSQRGARRTQVWLAVSAEVGTLALAGVILGLVVGVIAVLAISGAAGLPGGAVLRHSLVSVLGVAIVVGVWVVATLAIVVTVSAPEGRRRGRGLRLVDVAAIGAAVAVVIGLSSGKASAGTLTGNRLLYILLPALVCFVAAVAAGRLLAPAMRLGERWTRGAATALHLAFLALARAPARTVATVGFLLVSIGLALFAVSYRATLDDGARDEAAFAVPLDFSLTEGSQLVLPLQAASLSRYEAIAPGRRRLSRAAPHRERPRARHDGALADGASACPRRRSRSSTGDRTSRASRRARSRAASAPAARSRSRGPRSRPARAS